jgi:hypothetical protein
LGASDATRRPEQESIDDAEDRGVGGNPSASVPVTAVAKAGARRTWRQSAYAGGEGLGAGLHGTFAFDVHGLALRLLPLMLGGRAPNRWLIQEPISSRTCGAMVSSMLAYSVGSPVLAV